MASSVRLSKIHKALGGKPVLRDVDLEVKEGELLVLVGPSGCGKSTLLRLVAGLSLPDQGSIFIGDSDVTDAAPRERDVAMVFQSYALYPHLSVRENLGFGLRLRKLDKELIATRIQEVATMLGLTEVLDRRPAHLSGGQRQRVAMGRAIARRPKVFLFDEPLSNLDAKLRNRVRLEIRELHRSLGTTMMYVTHDQLEAMTLADRLVVLEGGVIQQIGTPIEVFERPANTFVAGFMGAPPMNLVPLGSARTHKLAVPQGAATLGVRPHELMIRSSEGLLSLKVRGVELTGAEKWIRGSLVQEADSEGEQEVMVRVDASAEVDIGAELQLHADPNALHFFNADGVRCDS